MYSRLQSDHYNYVKEQYMHVDVTHIAYSELLL